MLFDIDDSGNAANPRHAEDGVRILEEFADTCSATTWRQWVPGFRGLFWT
ncbi:MAG: hypothetical protein JO007_05290 [Alphaproteobacteria bacterium]|nr:hypothetical protein [Alphaproteobacteria bacterium]